MIGWIIAAGILFTAFRKKVVQAQSGPTLPTLSPSEIPFIGATTPQQSAGLITFLSHPDNQNLDYTPATTWIKTVGGDVNNQSFVGKPIGQVIESQFTLLGGYGTMGDPNPGYGISNSKGNGSEFFL